MMRSSHWRKGVGTGRAVAQAASFSQGKTFVATPVIHNRLRAVHAYFSELMLRLLERGLLLYACFALVLGAPILVRHAVDGFAAHLLGHREALGVGGLLHPVGQAVAAETGKVH